VVAGYRIERVLGSGGMGSVYLAANPTLPRLDALKVLSAELSRDPDFRARFVREADVAAALDHPQIVSVYNRGETDGQLWIAMQFVDGTDADDALRAGTMTAPRAVHIISEVAKALDFAHAHNVVHRDVKPANFLLSGPADANERVLLGDFGIARALDDVGLTATGSVMATLAYAAPEVLSGMPFDGRADIYSLGCTLFRLLTGKTPFHGNNGPAAVMMAHLQHPPPHVTELKPFLPAAFDEVIAIAMAKDPGYRYQSAADLAYAAQAALIDTTASVRVPMTPVPSADVNSYPADFQPTAAAWWQPDGPRTMMAPPPTKAASRRRRVALIVSVLAVLAVGGTTAGLMAWRSDTRTGSGADPSVQQSGQAAAVATPTGAPANDVPASALRSILLTSAQIPGNTGDTAVVLEKDGTELLNDAEQVDNADCAGAWAAAQQRSYADSGYTGAAVQSLRSVGQSETQHGVTQAVLSFDSQQQALTVLQTQRRQFELCGAKPITVTIAGQPPQTWTFGQPATVSGVVTLTAIPSGGAGSCQRGVAARGNVIIDVRQCVPSGPNDVAALVSAMSAKVPRQ
jgi:serine/threonine-protein kinase